VSTAGWTGGRAAGRPMRQAGVMDNAWRHLDALACLLDDEWRRIKTVAIDWRRRRAATHVARRRVHPGRGDCRPARRNNRRQERVVVVVGWRRRRNRRHR